MTALACRGALTATSRERLSHCFSDRSYPCLPSPMGRKWWCAARAHALVLVLLGAVAVPPSARAVPAKEEGEVPQEFSARACYQMVGETGRMIAWARWELGAAEEQVQVRFPEDTPAWVVDLTRRWIEDAYHWEVTDDQARQWTGAQGAPAGAPPHAEELTTPQTIALWLRRIAQHCTEQHV